MTITLLIASCLAVGAGGDVKPPAEKAFDLQAILAPPLHARILKTSEADGILTEEVMFRAEQDAGKDVDIFALFSYPKNAAKLPAFVWNQGGLAQASSHFPVLGAKRGYAVLCIDFPMPGYRSTGGYPIVSGLELGDDPKKAPIYHGAVALLRAVSFLQSRAEVDPNRIGMAGSSWGGFYTTLMAGLDPRLKVGSSMFGCGRLELGNLWWDGRGRDEKRDAVFRERWRTTLDPAERLANGKTPIAWFTGTNDVFYWLPSIMASRERAAGPTHLGLLPNMNHALTPEIDEQVFAWLDVHLKGAAAFNTVSPLTESEIDGKLEARWKFGGPRKVVRAELLLSHGDMGNWQSRYWRTIPAEIQGETCVARLPKGGFPYLLLGQVIDQDGFRSATPMKRLERAFTAEKPDYDGCSDWGGFEPDHQQFLKLQGLGLPAITQDAREGKHAARLKAGKTMLRPILYTAGWPHRLTLSMKATSKTEVSIALDGTFDGKPQREQKVITVGPDWIEATLDFTPPETLTGAVNLLITSPTGSEVTVDAVRFRPK